jgi:hypothetical protein
MPPKKRPQVKTDEVLVLLYGILALAIILLLVGLLT